MKFISHLLFTITISLSAHAQSLLHYTVVTKGDIFAECSDFMGQTMAGGDVYLRDFLIDPSKIEWVDY